MSEQLPPEQLPDEWIPMTVAAKRIGISTVKVSRLAARGRIATQQDPYDRAGKAR